MGNRSGSLMAMVALVAISVAMPVAQAPVAAQQQQQYGRIAKYNAACTEVTNIRKKEHLTALPANVIEPKRTPEGWPDLQGAWNSNAYRVSGIHSIELGLDPAGFGIQCQDAASSMGNLLVDPMRGMIPYRPAALAKKMEYLAATYAPAKRMDTDTDVRCFVRGVPHDVTNGAFRIRYIPGYVVIFSDGLAGRTRIVPMDGSAHIGENVKLMMGDPRGHWEGHTLVVESTNNSDDTWFDKHGTFHSDAMRVVERWTMVDQNTMYYEATIDDPTVFTRPWKLAMTFDRTTRENTENREDSCHEGERAVDTMVRAGLRARAVGIKGYHIHVDLDTGKAIRPEEQKYLDESGQPLGLSYAPRVPDEVLPQK